MVDGILQTFNRKGFICAGVSEVTALSTAGPHDLNVVSDDQDTNLALSPGDMTVVRIPKLQYVPAARVQAK